MICRKKRQRKYQEEVWHKFRSYKNRIWEINDAIKCTNVRIIGIPEGEEDIVEEEDVVKEV